MKPHLFVAVVGWGSRVVFALVGIASIRLLSTILGPTDYAAYSVLYGLAGWFALGDLGLGPGLQNAISRFRAQQKDCQHLISSALLMVSVLLVSEIIFIFFLSPLAGPWVLGKLLVPSTGQPMVVFLAAGIVLTITGLASIQYRIWFAEQKGYWSHIVPTLGPIIGYLLVNALISINTPNKLFWTCLLFLAPSGLIPLLAMATRLQLGIFRDLPRHFKTAGFLLGQSKGFFLFSVLAASVLNIDNIVASQFLPADEIIGYNVLNKLFGFGLFGYSALLTALWPELTEAFAKGHLGEIRGRIQTHLFAGLLSMSIFCVIVSLFSGRILNFLCPTISWKPTTTLLLLLSFYQLVRVWTDTFAMVLQSANRVNGLLFWVPVQAFVGFFFQVALAPRMGASGISLGVLGSFLTTVGWALPRIATKLVCVHSPPPAVGRNFGLPK